MPLNFRKLVAARFLFSFGTEMQAVVVGWRMYHLTRDPLHLGLVGLAEAVPALSIALYAGYLVDQSRPLVVYRNVVLGCLLSALIVFLSQLDSLALDRTHQIFALYFASFVAGTARSFAQPAIYAVVPKLVLREDLSRASAWTASALQIARIAGPAIGGFTFGYLGLDVTMGVVTALLVAAAVTIYLITASPHAPRLKEGVRLKEELFSGAKFVFRHPILLPALTLDMISVFFGGVTALLPIFASDILQVGPRGLGMLRGAPAIGAAVITLILTRYRIRHKAGGWLFGCVFGFSISILVFGLSHSFVLSLIALGLSGAFDSVSMVIRSTAVQLSSPEAMRGRISAVNSIFIGSSNELGEFESGMAAKLLGTVPAVIFGGAMSLLTVILTFMLCPALRALDLEKLAEEKA